VNDFRPFQFTLVEAITIRTEQLSCKHQLIHLPQGIANPSGTSSGKHSGYIYDYDTFGSGIARAVFEKFKVPEER